MYNIVLIVCCVFLVLLVVSFPERKLKHLGSSFLLEVVGIIGPMNIRKTGQKVKIMHKYAFSLKKA